MGKNKKEIAIGFKRQRTLPEEFRKCTTKMYVPVFFFEYHRIPEHPIFSAACLNCP
jgi:hypothetical protein